MGKLLLFRSWKHISTPVFVVANQFDQDYFSRFTCGVTQREEDYKEYELGTTRSKIMKTACISF